MRRGERYYGNGDRLNPSNTSRWEQVVVSLIQPVEQLVKLKQTKYLWFYHYADLISQSHSNRLFDLGIGFVKEAQEGLPLVQQMPHLHLGKDRIVERRFRPRELLTLKN